MNPFHLASFLPVAVQSSFLSTRHCFPSIRSRFPRSKDTDKIQSSGTLADLIVG